MKQCKISIYLANFMIIYIFGSIYYIIMTRNIGTPFNDSLLDYQKIIKKKSSKIRKKIFIIGIVIGIILCIIFITESDYKNDDTLNMGNDGSY